MDFQTEIYKRWPPYKRLQAALELYRLAKEIIRAREKRLHPDWSAQDLEKQTRSFFR